jgi:hypothetical protein
MALRDKIAANAAPFLEPGETIRGVLAGQTASQYLLLLGWLPFILTNRYRTIVATDRRILVLDAGRWRLTAAKGVITQLPLGAHLGPWTGNVWHKVQVGDETLRIHRRFKKDVEAIG